MYIYTTIRLHTYLFTFVCLRAHSIVRNALQIHFVIWPTLRFAIYLHLHSYFIVSKNNDILRTLTPMVSYDPQKQTCISYSVVYDKTICLMPDTLFHINLCHFSKILRKTEIQHNYMGLLPDTQNCGCACARNPRKAFSVAAGKRSRHASRHVRHARAVMHARIAN